MTCFTWKIEDSLKIMFWKLKMNVFAIIWFYIPVEMKLRRHNSIKSFTYKIFEIKLCCLFSLVQT